MHAPLLVILGLILEKVEDEPVYDYPNPRSKGQPRRMSTEYAKPKTKARKVAASVETSRSRALKRVALPLTKL